MENHYHTQLKASKEFWQNQLRQQIINYTESQVNKIDGDKIAIESIDCTVEQDIIKLSKNYPDQTFEAKYTAEDPYKNLATTYHYLDGKRKFIKEEYEYCFTFLIRDRNKLDPTLFAKFQDIAKEYFRNVDNYRVRTSERDPTYEDQPIEIFYFEDDTLITPCIEYINGDGDVILTAKKYGITYLDVTVKFLNQNSTQENTVDDFTQKDYVDVPF